MPYERVMTTYTAFGGKGWECPLCGGLVAQRKDDGPRPCPWGCVIEEGLQHRE